MRSLNDIIADTPRSDEEEIRMDAYIAMMKDELHTRYLIRMDKRATKFDKKREYERQRHILKTVRKFYSDTE